MLRTAVYSMPHKSMSHDQEMQRMNKMLRLLKGPPRMSASAGGLPGPHVMSASAVLLFDCVIVVETAMIKKWRRNLDTGQSFQVRQKSLISRLIWFHLHVQMTTVVSIWAVFFIFILRSNYCLHSLNIICVVSNALGTDTDTDTITAFCCTDVCYAEAQCN